MALVISVDNGKYIFKTIPGDYRIACDRHGEKWIHFSEGHSAILALMYRVHELEEQIIKTTKEHGEFLDKAIALVNDLKNGTI